MKQTILVLGATGMLGQAVARSLAAAGNRVRVLVRNHDKAVELFGGDVEILEGSVEERAALQSAMDGCQAVHLSLPTGVALSAMRCVTETGKTRGLERISYISATTVCERNRWFELIDVKARTEEVLRSSGIGYTIFCPTWALETLRNFVRGNRIVVILSENPPPLHFVAAADLGRMVAASYESDRALGKRLFVHGPESLTLPCAIKQFAECC